MDRKIKSKKFSKYRPLKFSLSIQDGQREQRRPPHETNSQLHVRDLGRVQDRGGGSHPLAVPQVPAQTLGDDVVPGDDAARGRRLRLQARHRHHRHHHHRGQPGGEGERPLPPLRVHRGL